MPADHTPGPWEVISDTETGQWLVRHREDCAYISQEDAHEEAVRLNAAERAPQLLAALQVAEDWLVNATFDRIGRTQEDYNAAMDKIAAAIKAAKGAG